MKKHFLPAIAILLLAGYSAVAQNKSDSLDAQQKEDARQLSIDRKAARQKQIELLFQLLPVIADQFSNVFPELRAQLDFVTRVVKEEEEAFLRTLAKGIDRLNAYISSMGASEQTGISEPTAAESRIIPGGMVFLLFDTYGFPADLTALIARENEWQIDEQGFETEMLRQKQRSRAATTIDTEDWITVHDAATTDFVGYNDLLVHTEVVKYRKVKTKGRQQYQVVLRTTPFYAESGGQVGDTGTLDFGGEVVEVVDTRKENNLIIQLTDALPADIDLPVTASVNLEKRRNTAYNHTATHLLHAALRQVLGTHVAQKGSLVSPAILRFDFSHFSKMTDEEIRRVEIIVNDKIRENIPVEIRELPKDEAMKLGAMALFGEKYGALVRVVTADPSFSIELCGGTHVAHTGMIGVFSIVSESAVAAGVRRIEAVTGAVAMRYFMERLSQYKNINELLKTKDPLKAIEKLIEDKNALEKKLEGMEARHLVQVRNELLQKDEIINGINFIGDIVEVGSADALKKLCYDLKSKLNDYVAVLCANIGGKPFVAIGISDTVVAARQLDAGQLIRDQVAPLIKGGGGGQRSLATAGGQDASQLQAAINAVKQQLG